MTTNAVEVRPRRLEKAAASTERVVVVSGTSDAEHEAKIAKLIALGEATVWDLFVAIRKPIAEWSGER